jgi:ABC-type Fe3+ transport system permease subunit
MMPTGVIAATLAIVVVRLISHVLIFRPRRALPVPAQFGVACLAIAGLAYAVGFLSAAGAAGVLYGGWGEIVRRVIGEVVRRRPTVTPMTDEQIAEYRREHSPEVFYVECPVCHVESEGGAFIMKGPRKSPTLS